MSRSLRIRRAALGPRSTISSPIGFPPIARSSTSNSRSGTTWRRGITASRWNSAAPSTTFLVLQRQLTLSNAEAAELNAQTALNKAIVRLQQVTGTILAANGFDVKTAGTGALDGLPAALQANPTLPTPAPSGAP